MSEEEGYQEMMLEREREAIEALRRCMKAGANPDDLKTLARECGLDIRNVILNGEING